MLSPTGAAASLPIAYVSSPAFLMKRPLVTRLPLRLIEQTSHGGRIGLVEIQVSVTYYAVAVGGLRYRRP